MTYSSPTHCVAELVRALPVATPVASECLRIRLRRTLFFMASLAWFLTTSSFALAQPAEGPKPGEMLKQAHEATKAAKTDEEFSEIVRLCQQALDVGANELDAAYAKQL